LVSSKLPDFLFQLIIAGALSSAFIPVFADMLNKGKKAEANKMASTLMLFSFVFFGAVSVILFIFAPLFLQLLNLGSGYSPSQMDLMTNLMRVIIFGQIVFLIATFFSAILQSHNHFFIPGIAAATYNLGIIIGIILFSGTIGIFAPAVGVLIGAACYALFQIPLIRKVGFTFKPEFTLNTEGVKEVLNLIWPRTLSLFIFQIGTILTVSFISFLPSSGRNYVILDFAQTLAFAPIVLFGQSIAQAAFPVLARKKDNIEEFRETFMASFNQMLYLVLPVSALFIILRIPIVRLVFGAARFDWQATVLTGRTLAFFSLAVFAQALIYLVSRAFYALHDTKTPLRVGAVSTLLMLVLSFSFVSIWNEKLIYLAENYNTRFGIIPSGVESIAFAYSIAGIFNLVVLLYYLNKKIHIFRINSFWLTQVKIFLAVFFMAISIYVPIKLLDQLVFDTTRTVNLILLTGISGLIGFVIYIFLTWLLNVKEASIFLLIFQRISGFREIIRKSEKIIETRLSQ
jgi:putative peptidoglycan lipid II flippase